MGTVAPSDMEESAAPAIDRLSLEPTPAPRAAARRGVRGVWDPLSDPSPYYPWCLDTSPAPYLLLTLVFVKITSKEAKTHGRMEDEG